MNELFMLVMGFGFPVLLCAVTAVVWEIGGRK